MLRRGSRNPFIRIDELISRHQSIELTNKSDTQSEIKSETKAETKTETKCIGSERASEKDSKRFR